MSPAKTSFSSVQSLSRVRLLATPWIAARQASLSTTNSQSSLRLTKSTQSSEWLRLSLVPELNLLLRKPRIQQHHLLWAINRKWLLWEISFKRVDVWSFRHEETLKRLKRGRAGGGWWWWNNMIVVSFRTVNPGTQSRWISIPSTTNNWGDWWNSFPSSGDSWSGDHTWEALD